MMTTLGGQQVEWYVCVHRREIMRRKMTLHRLIALLLYMTRLSSSFFFLHYINACLRVFLLFFLYCSFTTILSVMRQFHRCN